MTDTMEGAGLQAFFDIGLKLGHLNDTISKDTAERRRARENTPIPYKMSNVVAIPTPTAPTAISLGGPEKGFFWELRTLTIGGLTFGTTAAGTAEVYATSQTEQAIAQNRNLSDLVDQATALPIVGGYSSGQIILQESERLRVVIVGGTAAQQYTAVAFWRQYRTTAYATEINA